MVQSIVVISLEGNTRGRVLIRNLVDCMRRYPSGSSEVHYSSTPTDNLDEGSSSIKYGLWSSSEADDLVNKSGAPNPQIGTAFFDLT